jgi:hypothetical protein
MIEEAEERGDLQPGQTVVELTSGNTGTGLAIVCAVTKHPCVLVMSEGFVSLIFAVRGFTPLNVDQLLYLDCRK